MWTFLLGVILGLLASCRSDQLQVNFRSCSIAGVFMAEGKGRHALTFNMAEKVCEQQESVMASPEQLEEAYTKKMQTCRNGWTSNQTIAILRQSSHEKCAKNATGLLFNTRVTAEERYDVYCYDEHAGPKKNCTKQFQLTPQLSSPAPGEPDAFTTAGSQDMLEPTPKPDNVSDSETGNSTEVTGDDALEENMTTLSADGGLTTVNSPLERNNSKGGSNFTFDELDPLNGSGMQPNFIEEEELSPVTPSNVPEEAQGSTENERHGGEIKDADITAATGEPKDNRRVVASDQKDSNDSSNWLVVIGVIVAVAAILFVCAVVAKRKSWCGRQKTLVITSKDGGEGNRAAAASSSHSQDREQEMVTLMNKENIQENGNTEEFTVITLEESPDKDQQA